MRRYILASVFLAACVNSGDETVLILTNQAPAAGCVVGAEEGGAKIASGAIDVDTVQGYVFTPLVKNYAVGNGGTDAHSIAFVGGAHVDIHFADEALESSLAGTDLTRFQVPQSGSIDPDGGTHSFIFEIVPQDLIAMFEGEFAAPDDRILLLVDVSMFGTLNGGSFETQTFRYPVEVCDGCLETDVGLCSDWPASTVFSGGGACNQYQDGFIDCCTSASGTRVCPAIGTMP